MTACDIEEHVAPGNYLLLWDFDNTLAWREGMWSGALITALAEVGHDTTDIRQVRDGLQSGFPWHRPDVGHEHLVDADSWWTELAPVLRGALHRADIRGSIANDAVSRVRDIYLDPATWSVFPDARATLRLAAERGWRNAILSNHVPELGELVAHLGLDDHLEATLTSAELGWEKPNRRAFDSAVRRLGSPRHVVMIGDSRRADYDGAIAAGLAAVLISRDGSSEYALLTALNSLPGPNAHQ